MRCGMGRLQLSEVIGVAGDIRHRWINLPSIWCMSPTPGRKLYLALRGPLRS